ncbi:hypothetical protein LAWI1_G006807, partial [Lachnellula willkommii]
MQFLNVVQIPDDKRAFSYEMKKISFFPATESKYYQGNAKAASCVQNAIAACRQGVLMPSGGSKNDIEIVSGDGTGITASQAADLKNAMLPLLTQEECLARASFAKDKGDVFFEAKNYLDARQEYALAACLLGHDLWTAYSGRDFEKPSITQQREPRTLLLRIFMEAFRLALTLEQPDLAQDVVHYAARGNDPAIIGEDFALDILECMKFQEFNALLPTRILDIGGQKQDRISLREFPTGSHGQYAALSHCWGTKQTFITSSTNLEDRKKSIDFNELPQTFRDAVSVSRSLGINYLWIDSLCIIQNDIDDWKRESIKMEQVYSDATLVISASRATSDSTGFLNPRRTDEIISISSGKGEKMSTLYLPQALQPFDSTDPLKSEPLHQRGWALQERYLPRRTLYFGSHQTFWNCQTLSRSEDGRILQRPWFDFQELILPANENP